MGRVHQALRKSESERAQATATSMALERPENEAAAEANNFDFVNYSLNSPAAAELGRIRTDEAPVSQPLVHQEVELNVSRIDPHLVMFYGCDPRASTEYNKLAATIIAAATTRQLKRIAVTSAHHGEGRTSVLLNVAAALAAAKKRVLVVDTDLERPSIARFLGVQTEVGLADTISRGLQCKAATIRLMPMGLDILPSREKAGSSAEILASPAFTRMLNECGSSYDFVLFDSPPLLDSNDFRLLGRVTDATLLVLQPGRTKSSQLAAAIGGLTQDSILGVVLNRTA